MAFDVASSSKPGKRTAIAPSMNVTPLVDVVLVLLIIFMVVTPLLVKQVSVRVPEKNDTAAPADAHAEPSVLLEVQASGLITLNKTTVAAEELQAKLARVLAARSDKVVFFKSSADVEYGVAIDVIDTAKAAGAVVAVQP